MAEEKNNNVSQEQDISEILKVRREKLKALQDAIAKEGATPEEINAAKADL